MDMRLHWLHDRECQKQFRIYWQPEKLIYADYWTKHHSGTHYQNMRKDFLSPNTVVEMLRIKQSMTALAAYNVSIDTWQGCDDPAGTYVPT